MKKFFAFLLPLMLCLSCQVADFAEEEGESNEETSLQSAVKVVTRGSDGGEMVYPLSLFVFKEDGTLFKTQQIATKDEVMQLFLSKNTQYKIVVVSADEEYYEVPENPTLSSLITMKDGNSGNIVPSPLQIGTADIMPSADKATVMIQMAYRVASLSVTLDNMPSGCQSATVTVSSVSTALTFGGQQSGQQTARVALQKESSSGSTSSWKAHDVYLFPSSSETTSFTISYTENNEEKSSAVNYLAPLRAATPYSIHGSVLADNVVVTGSVSPSSWGTPVPLTFSFAPGETITLQADGSGSQGGGSGGGQDTGYIDVEELPKALSEWQGHFVFQISDIVESGTETTANVLLISLSDEGGMTSANNADTPQKALEFAASYSEYSLTGWRIPSAEEAQMLRAIYVADIGGIDQKLENAKASPIVATDDKGNNIRYLCEDATKTFSFKPGNSYNSIKDAGATVKTYHLRLIKTVKVRVKKS